VATATEIGLLWLLVHPLHVPRWVAFWVVQFYCNAATFLLYKYWAFDAAELGKLRTQYVKQLVIFGGSLALNTAIPSALTYKFHVEPVLAFIVSQVVLEPGDELRVTVERADGVKCERCWKYSTAVGEDAAWPTVCDSCSAALKEMLG